MVCVCGGGKFNLDTTGKGSAGDSFPMTCCKCGREYWLNLGKQNGAIKRKFADGHYELSKEEEIKYR